MKQRRVNASLVPVGLTSRGSTCLSCSYGVAVPRRPSDAAGLRSFFFLSFVRFFSACPYPYP